MLPALKADHAKQLLFLTEQNSQVIQDFCKLAVDYLHKGPNLKLYVAAAQKLQVEPETIRSSVEALINLLVESSKHRLCTERFLELVTSLGFSDDGKILFSKLHEVKQSEITQALCNIGLKSPQYLNMEWRFQVQTASRSLLNQVTSSFTMDLALKSNENFDEVEHVSLQIDPTNLLHMIQELESAMNAGRSQHIRRVKRSIK